MKYHNLGLDRSLLFARIPSIDALEAFHTQFHCCSWRIPQSDTLSTQLIRGTSWQSDSWAVGLFGFGTVDTHSCPCRSSLECTSRSICDRSCCTRLAEIPASGICCTWSSQEPRRSCLSPTGTQSGSRAGSQVKRCKKRVGLPKKAGRSPPLIKIFYIFKSNRSILIKFRRRLNAKRTPGRIRTSVSQ